MYSRIIDKSLFRKGYKRNIAIADISFCKGEHLVKEDTMDEWKEMGLTIKHVMRPSYFWCTKPDYRTCKHSALWTESVAIGSQLNFFPGH